MIKETLILARLARYVLRRAAEVEREGRDAVKYRNAFHKIVQLFPRVMTGKISPEDMKPLLDFLDKSGMSAKMDGRADAKGKGGKEGSAGKGNWVTIHGTHVQIGKGGQVTKGPVNLQGKTVPQAKPQGGQSKSGESSGGSGTSNSSGNTGNNRNTVKAKPQAKKQSQSGNSAGNGKPQQKQSAGTKYSEVEYKKTLLGAKTSDGKTVKGITHHAMSRMKERNIFPKSVKKSLENATPTPGNIPGRSVYDHKGTRVVLDDGTSHIWTVIYRGKGKK